MLVLFSLTVAARASSGAVTGYTTLRSIAKLSIKAIIGFLFMALFLSVQTYPYDTTFFPLCEEF